MDTRAKIINSTSAVVAFVAAFLWRQASKATIPSDYLGDIPKVPLIPQLRDERFIPLCAHALHARVFPHESNVDGLPTGIALMAPRPRTLSRGAIREGERP
jgi:hypothetical protein